MATFRFSSPSPADDCLYSRIPRFSLSGEVRARPAPALDRFRACVCLFPGPFAGEWLQPLKPSACLFSLFSLTAPIAARDASFSCCWFCSLFSSHSVGRSRQLPQPQPHSRLLYSRECRRPRLCVDYLAPKVQTATPSPPPPPNSRAIGLAPQHQPFAGARQTFDLCLVFSFQ